MTKTKPQARKVRPTKHSECRTANIPLSTRKVELTLITNTQKILDIQLFEQVNHRNRGITVKDTISPWDPLDFHMYGQNMSPSNREEGSRVLGIGLPDTSPSCYQND